MKKIIILMITISMLLGTTSLGAGRQPIVKQTVKRNILYVDGSGPGIILQFKVQ